MYQHDVPDGASEQAHRQFLERRQSRECLHRVRALQMGNAWPVIDGDAAGIRLIPGPIVERNSDWRDSVPLSGQPLPNGDSLGGGTPLVKIRIPKVPGETG